jgi:sugar lactone lactonase YvrE
VDVEEGRLYWLDGTGRRVGKPAFWRFDPRTDTVESWALDRDVGAMALRRDGGLVLALDDGFYFYDLAKAGLDKAGLELIRKIEEDQPRTRLNDGKVDRRGRFFAGGMDDKEELKICGLWRLDSDLSVTKVDGGIICSNGPCWSPDDKTFYFASGPTTTTSLPAPWRTSASSPPPRTIPGSPTARPSMPKAAYGTPS